MKAILFCFCACWLVACNNNATTNAEEEDTVEETENADAVLLQKNFPDFFNYLQKQDSSFKQDSFLLSGENFFKSPSPLLIDAGSLQQFKPLLLYNNDSTKAIDLYSYNYMATTANGQLQLESAEPDTEIGLLDFKSNTRRRLFFSGPSYAVWDGAWVNEKVILAGAEIAAQGKIIPTFWLINLPDSTQQTFTYKGTVKADMQPYEKQKIAQRLKPSAPLEHNQHAGRD